jgi:glycosyltransferase involved in cell wall biosynthesis
MKRAVYCFYGYFLKGTGSAIYARELCRSMNRLGINLVVFSQEDEPGGLDFISSAFEISRGKLKRLFEREPIYEGETVHIRPDLEGVLPVYVYDSYPSYRKVITFADMTEKDLLDYARSLQEAVHLFQTNFSIGCGGLIVHHLVPIPYIVFPLFSEIQCKKISIFHGSDLNFAIRKNRLMENIFEESLRYTDRIVALTEAGAKDVISYSGSLQEIIEVISPGIDTQLFYPRPSKEAALEELKSLMKELPASAQEQLERKSYINALYSTEHVDSIQLLSAEIEKIEARKICEPDLIKFLEDSIENELIVFAGKYLWTKGISSLLLSMPFVWNENPDASLLLIGYGSSRGFLEKMLSELWSGNLLEVIELVSNHRDLDLGSREDVIRDAPVEFVEKLRDKEFLLNYKSLCDFKNFKSKVKFGGYLDHKRLAPLLSMADVFVAPSLFKESFGLVLLEAASSGTIPVGSCHSGFSDILRGISDELKICKDVICPELDESFIESLSVSIIDALRLSRNIKDLGTMLHDFVNKYYSWDASVKKFVSLLSI